MTVECPKVIGWQDSYGKEPMALCFDREPPEGWRFEALGFGQLPSGEPYYVCEWSDANGIYHHRFFDMADVPRREDL